MNFHNIHYNCKVCGRPGIAKASMDCTPEWIDQLVPMICCNICADAREHRRKAEDQIFRACHLLKTISDVKDEDKAAKIRGGARKALEVAVPNFARSVCEGYRLQTVMDSGWVNDFYLKPEKAGAMMAFYKNGIAELANQPPLRDEP